MPASPASSDLSLYFMEFRLPVPTPFGRVPKPNGRPFGSEPAKWGRNRETELQESGHMEGISGSILLRKLQHCSSDFH